MAGIALATVAAVILGVHFHRKHQAGEALAAQCDQVRAFAHRLPPAPSAPSIAVLGDSYAEGWTLPDPAQAWPFVAFPSVANDAVAGSGFINPGPCGGQTFADRADDVLATAAPVIVVQGGLNDTTASQAQEMAAAKQVLSELVASARVYVVGPPLAPARDAADVRGVDRALAAAAAAAGAAYISTMDWQLTYGPDRLHPDTAGAAVFGQRVAASVSP